MLYLSINKEILKNFCALYFLKVALQTQIVAQAQAAMLQTEATNAVCFFFFILSFRFKLFLSLSLLVAWPRYVIQMHYLFYLLRKIFFADNLRISIKIKNIGKA